MVRQASVTFSLLHLQCCCFQQSVHIPVAYLYPFAFVFQKKKKERKRLEISFLLPPSYIQRNLAGYIRVAVSRPNQFDKFSLRNHRALSSRFSDLMIDHPACTHMASFSRTKACAHQARAAGARSRSWACTAASRCGRGQRRTP